MRQKNALRKALTARLKAFLHDRSDAQIQQATASVCRHLEALITGKPRWIGLYRATPTEPDLESLRRWAYDHSIQCGVPAWDAELNLYRWCRWVYDPQRTWIRGPHGALEPPDKEWIDTEADWVVVPGLGFDEAGSRLGHGGGYIDRLLVGQPQHTIIGCAWSCQAMESPLPMEDHDRPVGHVVTERSIHSV